MQNFTPDSSLYGKSNSSRRAETTNKREKFEVPGRLVSQLINYSRALFLKRSKMIGTVQLIMN